MRFSSRLNPKFYCLRTSGGTTVVAHHPHGTFHEMSSVCFLFFCTPYVRSKFRTVYSELRFQIRGSRQSVQEKVGAGHNKSFEIDFEHFNPILSRNAVTMVLQLSWQLKPIIRLDK